MRYSKPLAKRLGLILLKRRNQIGLKQIALAKKAGCSQSVVSKLESGKLWKNYIEFFALMDALGVEVKLTRKRKARK